jgi:hypothetical protein
VNVKILGKEKDFVGHTIGTRGLMGTEKNIFAIKNYKRPTSKKEMLSFLGLKSYERKYVHIFPNYGRSYEILSIQRSST